MKLSRSLTTAIIILAIGFSTTWAQASKTIGTFVADENGEPNGFIEGEFTNELTSAKLGDIREGRYIMRQRYEDPFDPDEVAYNLYSGKPGAEAAKLNAFSLTDVPIKLLAKKKFYTTAEAEYDDDIAQVYFDGKYAYTAESTVFVDHSGGMVQLTAGTNELTPSQAATAAATPTQGKESTSAYEEDPYSSEDSEAGTTEETPNIEEASNEIAEDNYYNQEAADANMEAVYGRFGYGDDIQEYVGYSFIAVAGGLLTYAAIKHTKIAEAEDVVTALEEARDSQQFILDLDDTLDETQGNFLNTESGRRWEGHYERAKADVEERENNRNYLGAAGLVAGIVGGVLLTVDF